MSEQIPEGERAYFRILSWKQDLSMHSGQPSEVECDLERQMFYIRYTEGSTEDGSEIELTVGQARVLQKFLNDMLVPISDAALPAEHHE